MMVGSIFTIALTVYSCKKEQYKSRDTSGIKPPPVDTTTTPPVDPSLVVFDNADVKDGWETVGEVKITTPGQKEGAGYIKNTIPDGSDFMQFIKHLATPLDSKLTTANGQFSFWWYISDVSIIKDDGQIEITSGGDADKHEFGWSIAKLLPTLKNGWNEMNLNFRDADIAGGDPDPSAFNFFRVFFWTATKSHPELVTGVDGLVLRAIPPPPDVVFDNCDVKDGWETVGDVNITKPGQKEGEGYIKNTIPNGGDFMQYIKQLPAPLNTTFTEANGRFKFWWYVSDVTALKKDGSIEITSSGKSDVNETAWDVTPLLDNLKNGWNEITLDLDKGIKTGDGGADLTKIDHFRIFFFTNGKDHPDIVTGIDDLRFVSK
jgi:hypothetical protein